MQESQEILRTLASKYIDCGKSVIPVFGKRPTIANWSKFCNEPPTDDEFDSFKFAGSTGIGLCLGKASGLCCIDIDTKDEVLYAKIVEVIQHSPVGKYGAKGCTFFYRLPANIPSQQIKTVKFPCGSMVEFFFSGKQTLIPPSIHPETNKSYQWQGEALSPDYDIEYLPVFDISIIDAIEALAKGSSPSQAINNCASPVVGRNNAIQRQCAILINNRVEVLVAVSQLVQFDKENHKGNELFNDKSEFPVNDPYINALFFYSSQLRSINARKKPGDHIEVPSDLRFTASENVLSSLNFGEIKDFSEVSAMEPFCEEWIPEIMRDWIKTFSLATSQPSDALFMSLLCSLSSLLGSKIVIEPTRNDKSWREMANIYVMMIAASGGGKTQIEKLATAPLADLEKHAKEKYELNRGSLEQEKRRNEILLKQAKGMHEKAVMDGGVNIDELEANIRELEAKVKIPALKQFRSSNCTPEKLVQIIESSPNGHFHSADELGVLLKQYDKKGYELLKAIHLNLYNNGRFSYETKSSGSYVIEPCSLSILCSGQISVYNEYVRTLTKDGAQDDGHLQRFIPVVNVDSSARFNPDIKNDFTVPDDVQKIFNLAESTAGTITVCTSDDADAEMIRIKKKCIEGWHNLQKVNENMLAGVESKKRGHTVRIAFLLSFIKNEGKITAIDKDSVLVAEKIINNLYQRLEYCYRNKKDKMPELRAEFASMIEIGTIQSGMQCRDVGRLSNRFQSDKEGFKMLLKELEETNRIKVMKVKSDSKKIFLNPEYVKECGE